MIDSLYEKALIKKDNINARITNDFNNPQFNPSKFWRNHQLKEDKSELTICAGDGSINKKNFMGFIFYVIDAECLIYNKKLHTIESSELDIIQHHHYVDDRLRNYMGIFEVKNALNAFIKYDIDIFLFDGSILGNLIRPFPLEKKLTNNVKDEIKSKYLPELEKKLKQELEHSIVRITSSSFKDIKKTETMIYLENIENLMIISELINKKSVVAISKTSTSTEYFKSEIPDIAIFDRYSKKEGYSTPVYIKISADDKKRDFPIKNDFFRNLTFTIFYARLEDYKNILKFELPYFATEDKIKDILKIIKNKSAEGYPLLLKKAHNNVIIRKVDIERLSKIIGFMEKTGREML
ncbi:MAG: DNA double-strand break repair nuclease NurA [Methanobacterium sp.]|nr:DNA double-strand break repair nuclease NurA [Methanobacterium sp.]